MATNFITNTPSLKTTIADVRKLNAKKIFLGGENILDIINSSTPTIKHSQDTRETVTENDLWAQLVETTEDGTIIVHDDWVTNPKASIGNAWNKSITKVENNMAYVGDTMWANVQTEKIKDGRYMFLYCNKIESFSSDLPSLKNGYYMFSECISLKDFNSNLSSLTDGVSMFNNCFNLTSFSSDLSSLTDGSYMFYNTNITEWNTDLPSLTDGYNMFNNCSNINSFSSDLSSLIDGNTMFHMCNDLKSFNSDLPSLTTCRYMFSYCSHLTSFVSNLPSLTDSENMFNKCVSLKDFNSDLPSLTNGRYMFYGCDNLTSFISNLPSLTDGVGMFEGCSNLTSFNSVLPSLIDGRLMFSGCKLDAVSVMYIADTIKDITAEKQLHIDGTIPYVTEDRTSFPYKYSAPRGFMSNGKYVYTYNNSYTNSYTTTISAENVGSLTLGINVTNDADTIQQQLENFAQEATFDSWTDLKQTFIDKGWTVTFQYGSSTSITYGLRDGEQITPCPIFAKLIQVEDKDSAEYCTEDASTFYNIEWGHDVTDTSSYTHFNSLEDAIQHFNVIPKQ